MAENLEETKKPAMTKAEMVARLVGPSLKRDEEDIEFWRNASDELRGRTLYSLLRMVNAIGNYPEKTDRFPGFPKAKKTNKEN